MKAITPLIVITSVLLLSACASSPPPYRDDPAPEPRYEQAPMSLHDRVHDALQSQMGSAASHITVRVEGSTVYLSGHVESQADHDWAHEIAHDLPGVGSVNHSALKVH